MWRAFTRRAKPALLWSLAAGVAFGVLVYSYFYLWTAAGAWLFCLTALWVLARPAERSQVVVCISSFGAVAVIALLPFVYLLSLRGETTDVNQALVLTHAPDLFRVTELVSVFILAALAWQAHRGKISWKSPVVLFATSCAVVPFVVFNQQVITGHSLQSFHYEQFIINYQLLVSLVIMYKLIWSHLRIPPALWVAFVVIMGVTTGVKSFSATSELNRRCDEGISVFSRIEELRKRDQTQGAVLFDDALLAASAPTSSTFAVLWSPHMYVFATTTATEELERFYQYVYYRGVDEQTFETMLLPIRGGSQNSFWTVFGLHRTNIKMTENFQPISTEAIHVEVESYSAYVKGFSLQQARRWPTSYVVLRNEASYDLSNLDRWYERDGGERIGGSVLYVVRLRTQNEH
jgi:hypothetical protein